jgi:hypothetical protein
MEHRETHVRLFQSVKGGLIFFIAPAIMLSGEESSSLFRIPIFGGELDSTGQVEVQVARRGWSAGHVKSRP